MLELGRGALSKMSTRLAQPVQYSLPLGEQDLDLNALLGQGVPALSQVLDGLADYVDQHFAPGVLMALLKPLPP